MSFSATIKARVPAAGRTTRATPAARLAPIARAQSGSSGNPNVDDILAEANALLNAVSSGTAPPQQFYTPGVQESIDELTGLGFVCDESGCVLVLPTESTDEEGELLNTMMEGKGWRLGVVDDPEDGEFPALVSGPSWSMPLTATELGDVLFVLQQLRVAVASLADQGQWLPAAGERPASRAKWQSRHISMQATYASGGSPAFSVDLSFAAGKRTVSTTWPAEVVADAISRLDAAGVTSAPAPAKTVAAA